MYLDNNKESIKLRIGGMSCISCELRIEQKLSQTTGVDKAVVKYSNGTAVITYNASKITLDEIINIIEAMHYQVEREEWITQGAKSGKRITNEAIKQETNQVTEQEIDKVTNEVTGREAHLRKSYRTDKTESQRTKQESKGSKALGAVILIFALYTLMRHLGITNIFNMFPQAQEGMSYGMLFVIGLLTSVHCVAMCGGINLSQCIPQSAVGVDESEDKVSRFHTIRPSILYNLGRVLSYTLIGALVGAVGSVVSFTGSMKGIVQILAGVFMVIMGLNMLNVFPWLRKLNPRMPKIFAKKIQAEKIQAEKAQAGEGTNRSLYVGLLNGLMPCGPLQAMQLYALSTGDPMKGAVSMLLFSLGTVPLMFALGALSSILSKKFTSKVMTAGAILVVILGASMLNSGLSLSGFAIGVPNSGNSAQAKIKDGVQIVSTSLSSGRYEPITVRAGIPVKWTITAEQGSINGCNNRIFIPEYNIEKRFELGENVIEFTPTETGTYVYSCWMGMIRSTITVVDENGEFVQSNNDASNQTTGGTSGSGTAESNTSGAGTSGNNKPGSGVNNVVQAKEPVPAGYDIPVDEVAVGEILDDYQVVQIEMDDSRFTPAIVILQAGMETEFVIDAKSRTDENTTLLFPFYNTTLSMVDGENFVYLIPSEDFVFSTKDYSFYGYVKVVPDINNIDIDAIKEEVKNYETFTWDYSNIQNSKLFY